MDILRFIKVNKLSKRAVAELLFPKNKHPQAALDRHIRLGLELKETQLNKLKSLTNKVDSGFGHHTVGFKKRGTEMVFKTPDFKTTLNLDTMVSKIRTLDGLIDQTVIHSKGISIEEYLSSIASIINSKKSQDKL